MNATEAHGEGITPHPASSSGGTVTGFFGLPGVGLIAACGLSAIAVALLAGRRQDYIVFAWIWRDVAAGGDPWIAPDGRPTGNAYGPLFNALALLAHLHPLAPKVAMTLAWVGLAAWLMRLAGRRPSPTSAEVAIFAFFFLNPYFWIEAAYFAHFDILVACACVAALHDRLQDRGVRAGAWIGLGIALKFLPIALLPFLMLRRRGLDLKPALGCVIVVADVLGLSLIAWGPSTLYPLSFAAGRESKFLSIFHFLRGIYSPLRYFGPSPDWDVFSVPALAVALGLLFAWSLYRGIGPRESVPAAALLTLAFYKVGHLQFFIVPFALLAYSALTADDKDMRSLALAGLLVFSIGTLDVLYVFYDEMRRPPFLAVREAAGLPLFLVECSLCGVWAGRPPSVGRRPV